MSIFSRIVDWVTTPYTIFLILKDPAVPAAVKVRAVLGLVAILIYILSPIDLIPDVIPFSGWLDDLLVVPAGFAALRAVTPGIDVVEKNEKAQKGVRKVIFWAVAGLAGLALLAVGFFTLLIIALVKIITG